MSSTFFGLEIGRRALNASTLALSVVEQNTANVNTPGYSRQVVNFEATDPYTSPDFQHDRPGQLGTGVNIASITRIRDAFIDRRIYAANADSGALNNLRDIVGRVESAYNEPSDSGLGKLLTHFFNSFSDLAANPESGAIRSTVLNSAETAVSQFHSISTALDQINPEITSKIGVKVDEVNTLAGQIADLNKQIRLSFAAGDQPNDLLDKRGALTEQLSSLVDIQVTNTLSSQTGKPNGAIQINVGGYSLVQEDSANPLPKTITTAGGTLGLITATQDTIPLHGGELYGLVKSTTLLKGYRADLDTLASNLITAVNTQHASGYGQNGATSTPFFAGTDAASISVSPIIQNNLDAIAAASANPNLPNGFAPGNGDNATALAALASQKVIGSFSLNEYYNAKVAHVGADSRTYQTEADNQDKVIAQLKNQQSSVSGVSLDEELTRMLQYQRTFQSASRMINISDSLLDTIINGLGAGR